MEMQKHLHAKGAFGEQNADLRHAECGKQTAFFFLYLSSNVFFYRCKLLWLKVLHIHVVCNANVRSFTIVEIQAQACSSKYCTHTHAVALFITKSLITHVIYTHKTAIDNIIDNVYFKFIELTFFVHFGKADSCCCCFWCSFFFGLPICVLEMPSLE